MKKKWLGVIILILILVLIFGCYFYSKSLNPPYEGPTFCDAKNKCLGELVCIKFPDAIAPTCESQENIDNYPCPNGTIKNIAESLPLQLFCN